MLRLGELETQSEARVDPAGTGVPLVRDTFAWRRQKRLAGANSLASNKIGIDTGSLVPVDVACGAFRTNQLLS
ncbi:hypothetical protein M407DRAFT_20190 [Tulasnella calospora MUT 4182]|uniref:Uncharacterized protein n=1 Tax=Tulasnella calospora MUT 4182 TaxID=1051891 RepID=A0A0C3LAG9_9AGAM|nr:hypothetical protein M407DRAFT_20190 [Tulasnella calospora MUT 4182]